MMLGFVASKVTISFKMFIFRKLAQKIIINIIYLMRIKGENICLKSNNSFRKNFLNEPMLALNVK